MVSLKNTFIRLSKHPLGLVIAMGLCHLWIVWPGYWTSDTQAQYLMALSGLYNDHHPPMMSWVWGYLNNIWAGSGPLLLLHFSFLYGAIFYFIKSFGQQKIRFAFLLLPLIPQIFVYAGFIWKDVGFAFSFLCCAAYLSYCTSVQKPVRVFPLAVIFIILLYGTALKFQAQYCAPLVLLWISYSFSHYTINFKRFVPIFCALLLVFYGGLRALNDYWVPESQRNYSWQYVKIYDLAAMSAESGVMLLPDFTRNKNFSQKALVDFFQPSNNVASVDDLVFGADPILRKGENPLERAALYNAWAEGVRSYPKLYLKHRVQNVLHTLLSRPGFMYVPKVLSLISTPDTTLYRVLYSSLGFAFFVFMSHINVAILCLIYLLYSAKMNQQSWAATPLLFLNAIGLMTLLMFLFFSMAGTPRYTYVLVCMVHASHLFAYQCYKTAKERSLVSHLLKTS